MKASLFVAAIALLSLSACYESRVPSTADSGSASPDANSRDVMVDAGSELDVVPGQPCGCPMGSTVCRLPEMCCPVTRTCENPDRFNCSGSDSCVDG